MTVIQQEDFIASIAGALQYISYYHPVDYITSLAKAYEREQSPAARDAIAQILINSRMCAEGHRPICQDTGIVNAFVKLGMDVQFRAAPGEEPKDLQQMVDEGVRRAYLDPDNKLRASVLADPAGARKNTKDNTPAVVTVDLVRGNTVEVTVAAKGGGSEAKSKFVMLNPNDSVVEWVLKTVPTMGAGWCPPGILGIGIGGTSEKAMLLAKQSLMDPIDIQELIVRGPQTTAEKLRIELYDKVNRLGIGAQGLGGLTTVLDVKVVDTPCHAANLPVAMIPNCAATRHAHIVLDGSGPVFLDPPALEDWPKLTYDVSGARRVNLDTVTRDEAATWKPGEVLLLTGKLLTGRDAAHKRMTDMLNRGEKAARRFPQPLHLLRGPRGPGARRGRWPCRSHHGHAHGQVHPPDAGRDRAARHGGQGRARTGSDRGYPRVWRGVPDGRGRRGIPGFKGDSRLASDGVWRPGHGSDLRVRRQRHARNRSRGCEGNQRARDRPGRVAAKDCRDSDLAVIVTFARLRPQNSSDQRLST